MCFRGINNPIKVKNGEKVNVIKIVRINFINHFVPETFTYGDIHTYEPGRTYEQFMDVDEMDNSVAIGTGLHSYLATKIRLIPYAYIHHGNYITPDATYNASIDYDRYGVQAIGTGFKSIANYTFNRLIDWDIRKNYHLCLLVGHIPPGGTYYANQWGEVVSDMLTVDLIKPYYNGLYDKAKAK